MASRCSGVTGPVQMSGYGSAIGVWRRVVGPAHRRRAEGVLLRVRREVGLVRPEPRQPPRRRSGPRWLTGAPRLGSGSHDGVLLLLVLQDRQPVAGTLAQACACRRRAWEACRLCWGCGTSWLGRRSGGATVARTSSPVCSTETPRRVGNRRFVRVDCAHARRDALVPGPSLRIKSPNGQRAVSS